MEAFGAARSLLLGLLALGCGTLWAQASPGAATQGDTGKGGAKDSQPYVFALTALEDGGISPADAPFLSKLPALILGDLGALPPRYEDQAYRDELAERRALSDRFDKGNDLFKKLGDAASARLDPTLSGYARSQRLDTADDAVSKARDALSGIDAAKEGGTAEEAPAPPREVRAWDGKGLLLDLDGDSPSRAGRKQSINLVVSGRAVARGTYLEVRLWGTDVDLSKRVFEWDGFCAPDDPGPLAEDFAGKLSSFLADAPLARFDLAVKPSDSRILVDGKALDSSELRLYSPDARTVALSAWAPGYAQSQRTLELQPGENRGLVLDLSPLSYGEAKIALDPPDASLLVGGRAVDPSQPAKLEGIRDIAIASAKGYENKMSVLPAGGSAELSIKLRPAIGPGPEARADKAKDDFYVALGFLAIGVPVSSLLQGYQGMYLEAQYRQGTGFVNEKNIATAAYWSAVAATAGAAVYAVFKLIALLGSID